LDEKSRKQVVDQRREGKTIRQIAKNTGKSTRTVTTILKDEELGEIEAELRVKEKERSDVKQTNYTKALRLFSKGKSVLDVTIKLGITLTFGIYRPVTNSAKTITESKNTFRPCCHSTRSAWTKV
jgi:hypothetical protein